ncbi:alpha/beta hydrolase family protein [Rhodococcus sp. IEGM 1330]|uniref:alpha/beta hydrolase family protein n=1 Tax=Rhodococcus sp. IEGM 1330 TaxID=3082225 RepID=UPI0029546EDF|nr:alpha/beta fold hydrolase [Rhodococcus sp. IEGM 1330]MDV8020639.1 alpha/beta fold hydrolase [Rhodococcus sp. IEGM 1330]
MSNEPIPVLRTGRRVSDPALVVLVLGGGKDASWARSRPWHLAGLRMWPFTFMLRRAGRDISVQQLQYRYRGWNAPDRSPVDDARWALDRIRTEHPDVHVVVVGHSMGGRTAAALVDDPSIVGVVALAPWWPEGAEADAFGPGKKLLVMHGTADRWTDPRTSLRATERALERGATARYLSVPGGHFMLRNPRLWSRAARDFVLGIADEFEHRQDSAAADSSAECMGGSA